MNEINDNNNNNPELVTLENRIIKENTEVQENKDGEIITTVTKEETTIITTEEKKDENENQ
jgi:hypothetical protein